MAKTILVCGFGPGISTAVAEKFGAEGFSVALVARNTDKLTAGVQALEAKRIHAAAFPCDLADPAAVRALIAKVRAALGPITVVQWTAYANAAGDLLTADTAAVRTVLDVAISGLVAAVQEALPDLRKEKDSAVLITNGGLGYFDPKVDAAAVQWNAMGLAVANAAKHKLVGMLAQKLKSDGIYVGEVMVLGSVKGTAFDDGRATIEASAIAQKFWELYRARADTTAQVG
ncbi:MAG TPA: SDR family NAD(P)-dependent oxidoreductase [Polyangiaceae bacterium]|jgi:NAD(P)-dependent dehydrogenase (short-subunit alcohol dehydrogenase family)